MTQKKLEAMSLDQLVGRFVELTVDQGRAIEYSETAKYNLLFRQMQAVSAELNHVREINERC